MKNKHQGFIVPLLIVVVALLAIGAGVYVYTKNKPESAQVNNGIVNSNNSTSTLSTANWKTYTDTEIGFSFKYPADAVLNKDSSEFYGLPSQTVNVDYFEDKQALDRPMFLVRIFEKNADEVLKAYVPNDGSGDKILKDQIFTSKYVTGRVISIGRSIGSVQNIVLIEHDGKTFVITNETETDADILSTFTFTKNSPVQASSTISVSGTTLSVLTDGKVTQTISLDSDAIDAAAVVPGNFDTFITNEDVNFDGHNDIGVFTSTGYAGVNNDYDFYIFNPQTGNYDKSSTLVDISNPVVDPSTKEIKSNYRSGPQWYTDTFKFNGSSYTETDDSPDIQ